ncbi:MAG: hypothetical protein NVSMB62_13900 [Acidobacteriaceae bacterium]
MGLRVVPSRPRARDLLKLTDFPIHPFDQAHGVDTSGLVPAKHLKTGSPSDEHVTAYYGVAPSILRSLIGQWLETEPRDPIAAYTFVDIGAGKGRAMLVASEFAFRRVVGVELNPVLTAIARRNVAEWTAEHAGDPTSLALAPIEVLEQDALEYVLPTGPVLMFLFHPFEAPVLEELVRSVGAQLQRRKRTAFDILYVNAECREVLDANAAFTRLFLGPVAMSPEDHAADLEAIAQQKEYGSTGDEECAIYRWVG